MSLHGTVLPSTLETRSYLIGLWCFLSSCRKESFSALRTAGRSSTGTFTSPNARAPFQMDAIVPPYQGSTRAIHHLCTYVHTSRGCSESSGLCRFSQVVLGMTMF